MELAKGKYFYFLDADDYLVFNALETLLKYFEEFDLDLICFKSLPTSELDLFDSETKKILKILK